MSTNNGTRVSYDTTFVPEIKKICDIIKESHRLFEDGDPNVTILLDSSLFGHLSSAIIPALEVRNKIILDAFNAVSIEHIITEFMTKYKSKITDYQNIKSYNEIDFGIMVSNIERYLYTTLEKYCTKDITEYLPEYKTEFEKTMFASDTMDKILKHHIDVNEDIYQSTCDLVDKYKVFTNLANFSVSTLIKTFISKFDKFMDHFYNIHCDNIRSITQCNTIINDTLQTMTRSNFINNYIKDNTKLFKYNMPFPEPL